MKFAIVALSLLLVAVQLSQSAPASPGKAKIQGIVHGMFGMDGTADDQPGIIEPDWNTIKFKEITLDMKEIDMQPSEMYAKVLECIQKCMQTVSKNSYRDKCLAKTCDIY
jgi:hypothetical protein